MDGKYPHLHPSAINDFLRDLGYKGRFRAHGWRRFALTNGIDVLKAESDLIRRQMGHYRKVKFFRHTTLASVWTSDENSLMIGEKHW